MFDDRWRRHCTQKNVVYATVANKIKIYTASRRIKSQTESQICIIQKSANYQMAGAWASKKERV